MIAEVYQKEKEQENSMLISLVERIQTGDQQAFLDFYEMTKKAVVFNVRQNGVPERDLEDIVQDIYVKVFKNIASLKDPSSAFGWIRKIAVNTARNYHKAATAKHEELLYEKTGDDGDQLDPFDSFDVNDSMSAVLPMPAEIIDAREGSRMIYDMIMELPEKQGLSLMDYFYNDMSVSEIAHSMEVPENTVKSWLRRGKKAMQIKLETLAKEKGIKLYTTVLLPVIAAAFKKQAEAGEVPFSLDKMVRELIALVVAAGAAGGAASGLAGANLAGGLPEKIADNVVHGIEKNHVTGTGIIREPLETGTPLSGTSTPSGADIPGKDNVMTAGKGAAENAAETASANGAAMENAASAAGGNITAKAAAGTAGKAAAATLSKGALIKIAAVLMAGVIGGGVFLAVNNSGSNHQEVSVASTDEEAETVFAGNDNTAETAYAYEDDSDSQYAYESSNGNITAAADGADQKDISEGKKDTDNQSHTSMSNEKKADAFVHNEDDLETMKILIERAAMGDLTINGQSTADTYASFSAEDGEQFGAIMFYCVQRQLYSKLENLSYIEDVFPISKDLFNSMAYAIFYDYNGTPPESSTLKIVKEDDSYYYFNGLEIAQNWDHAEESSYETFDDGSVIFHVSLRIYSTGESIGEKTYKLVPDDRTPAELNSPYKYRISGSEGFVNDTIKGEYAKTVDDIRTFYYPTYRGEPADIEYYRADTENNNTLSVEGMNVLSYEDVAQNAEQHFSHQFSIWTSKDINHDGIDEFLIGDAEDGFKDSNSNYHDPPCKFYAIYTYENNKIRAALLAQKGENYCYGTDGYIYKQDMEADTIIKMELAEGRLKEIEKVSSMPKIEETFWNVIVGGE